MHDDLNSQIYGAILFIWHWHQIFHSCITEAFNATKQENLKTELDSAEVSKLKMQNVTINKDGYTVLLCTSSSLGNDPVLTTNLCSLINTTFQIFYSYLITEAPPPDFRRIPVDADLADELGPHGFIFAMYNGDLPVASIGAKPWNASTGVAEKGEEQTKGSVDLSAWEIVLNVVRQSDRYKGKGLAKELLEMCEKECLETYRRAGGEGPVRCITRCIKRDMLSFYERRGYTALREDDVRGIRTATAQKLVKGSS